MIYVHIPFCKSRCIYCNFYSTTLHDMQGRYTDALIHELHLRRDYLPPSPATVPSLPSEGTTPTTPSLPSESTPTTIYIGGGTPSVLTPDNLRRLTRALLSFHPLSSSPRSVRCSSAATLTAPAPTGSTPPPSPLEFTIECNPDDITRDFADLLVSCGINRVSMGVQTFSDSRLRFLHRRHTSDTITFAIRALRAAGIKNISIDLMFGFPGQTLDDWEHDISHAIRLDVEHISAYSLTYEEGTPLHALLQQGKIKEIDEELSRAMYERLCYRLTAAGYEHYEISNFARPGYRSVHNSNYWRAIPYLGIGAAAHSYDGTSRQWNVSDVHQYIDAILKAPEERQSDAPLFEREELSPATRYNDMITTALRTCEGIDLSSLATTYNLPPSFRDYLLSNAAPHISNGNLVLDNNHLHLTPQSLLISDSIMTDLIYV